MKPGTLGTTFVVVLLTALVAFGADNQEIEKLCGEGVELLKTGNPGKALPLFDQVLKMDYRHRDAAYFRALALYELKDYKNAEQAFKEVLLDHPGEMQAEALLGSIELQSGRVQEAKQRFLRVLGRYPDDVPTLINLGLAEYALGNRFAGEDVLKRALALTPRDSKLATLVYKINKENSEFTKAQEVERRRRILAKFHEMVNTAGKEWTRQYEQEMARIQEEERQHLKDLEKAAAGAPKVNVHVDVWRGR